MKNYPGAKSNSGIIQFLINNIPLHERYFELFAGSAQLFKNKKSADKSILADIDSKVIFDLKNNISSHYKIAFVNNCYSETLNYYNNYKWCNYSSIGFTKKDFIYLDPPYPEIARRSGKKYYNHELLTIEDHTNLINNIKGINANIMISTRPNDLYEMLLKDWRKKEFNTVDRVGKCVEVIYMNYDEPKILHQYDFLGEQFTDRQRIKRKINRFNNKISLLPQHEKLAILQTIIKQNYDHVKTLLSIHENQS